MILTLVTYSPELFLIINRSWSRTFCFYLVLWVLYEGTMLPYLILRLIPLSLTLVFVTTVASNPHDSLWVTSSTSSSEFSIRIGKLICVRWLQKINLLLVQLWILMIYLTFVILTYLQSCTYLVYTSCILELNVSLVL